MGEYYIDGVRYCAYRQPLADLPIGYHQLSLASQNREVQAILAVAPERCFENTPIQERIWGTSCQLETLRSARNWGIGDFSDLKELIELSASAGMDVVALNPLHAPHMEGADFASPYSPSDRRFLNPLYVDPECVSDFGDNVSVLIRSRQFQSKLAWLRASSHVE